MSTILRNNADVKAKAVECGCCGVCRVRVPEYDKVEKALYAWFLETRAKNIPVDGSMLMEKAKCFATALGEDDFTGGTGWQQHFKNRYGIVGKTLSGESGATSSNSSIEKWLSKEWPDICNSFSPSQMFSADETALFWQMLPDKTFDFEGSKCHGGKMSKVRIVECLDSEFQTLSEFLGVIPDGATARDFLSADDDAQAVADRNNAEIVADIAVAEEADPTSDFDEDTHSPTSAELASAFSVIRRCCGAMEGARLSHLDSVSKIEDSLMAFMAQKKKQSKLTDFFHAK